MKKRKTILFMTTSFGALVLFFLGVFFISYMVNFPLNEALADEAIVSLDDYLDLSVDPSFVTFIPEELRGDSASPVFNINDPVLGDESALINMVVFGDHVSEASAVLLPEIISAVQSQSKDVNLSWKDFPIPRMYKQSLPAAIAARCVQEQDEDLFWQVHEDFQAARASLNDEVILETISCYESLDQDIFNTCFTDQETLAKVQTGYLEAKKLDADIPPILYISGERYEGKYVAGEIVNYLRDLI